MVSVIGCSPPAGGGAPGSVTSSASLARRSARRASSSEARRDSISACTLCLARLTAWPAAGFSAGGREPRVFSAAVSAPFLPSSATRSLSSASRLAASSMRTRASSTRASRVEGVHVSARRARRRFHADGMTDGQKKGEGRHPGRHSPSSTRRRLRLSNGLRHRCGSTVRPRRCYRFGLRRARRRTRSRPVRPAGSPSPCRRWRRTPPNRRSRDRRASSGRPRFSAALSPCIRRL